MREPLMDSAEVSYASFSVAVVTRRQEVWKGLCGGQRLEALVEFDCTVSWHLFSPQELFVRLEEVLPDLLIYDTSDDDPPVIETIKLISENPRWGDLLLLSMCRAGEEEALYNAGAALCLPLDCSGQTLRRVSFQLMTPKLKEHVTTALQEHMTTLQQAMIKQKRDYASFAGRLSHEVRTPLGVIEGFTINMLDGLDGALSESQHQSMSIIQKNISRLKQYLGDVLDHSKLSMEEVELKDSTQMSQSAAAVRRKFRRRFLSLSEILIEVTELFGESYKNKGILLEKEIPRLLPRLWMERSKIRQVFINLLSNALKYTPRGGRVSLRATILGEDYQPTSRAPRGEGRKQAYVSIEVRDDGAGIPSEVLPTLFTEFVRAESTANQVEGSGIGLAVCQEIIQEHRGKIEIESEVGEGTCVSVLLPVDLRRRRPGKLYMVTDLSLLDKLLGIHPTYLQHVELLSTEEDVVATLEGGAPHLLLPDSDALQEILARARAREEEP